VTDDSVIDAARRMHLHESVQRLPQGYETVVGEQGETLPAAIEFQLGLTRALLANPALLLIEEPSGPFEEDTRAALEEAYQRLAQGRTVIFLPHRLSTLRRCEEILFLHRGRLAAIGTRDTLVNRSPLYRHWEYIHFNEFRSEFEMDEE
jgi:ABC-type multidrug transport system fused ATPase/permease subunit